MEKSKFYLLTLFCAALLCLGATSYVKAEESSTPRGRQRSIEKKDSGMFSELSKEEKQWLADHPKVVRAIRKKIMAKHREMTKRGEKNKNSYADKKRSEIAKRKGKESRKRDLNKDDRVDLEERKINRRKKFQSLPVEKREEIINKRIEKLNAEINSLKQML
ncbi:hypothetical protein KAI19_02180 [bacterium]|nr:hypothetical protein [bacterium]